MAKNLRELRREHEAYEARQKDGETDGGKTTTKKKKKATRKTRATSTRKTKTKAPQRKRLLWAIFSGSMKEEARFPYDQREAAEEKLEQLRAKSTKKLYYLQSVKEVISEGDAAEES